MTTSSAVPAVLLTYANATQEADDDLRVAAERSGDAVRAFIATSPDSTAPVRDLAGEARSFAIRNGETDAWVRRVGMRFLMADMGSLFSLRLPNPNAVVTVDDAALADVGYPARWRAADAGRTLADEVRAGVDDPASLDASVLERWSDEVEAHDSDAAFTVAFFEHLGVERTRRLALVIEEHWPRDRMDGPQWGLGVLAPFADALATAMDTRLVVARHNETRDPANLTIPDRYRLDESFVDDILEIPYSYDYDEPQEQHVALLFDASDAVFPTDVLVRLGNQVVVPRLASNRDAGIFGITPWAWEIDPVANVLSAISRSPNASLSFLESDHEWLEHDTLRMTLERWAEIDGDAGGAGAEVLRQALTHGDRDRAYALFERAMRDVADIGEIRSYFAPTALADGAAAHIDRIATTAATEGERDALVTAHRFLALVLADTEAAATVFEATLGHTATTFEAARRGDSLGSEVWNVGALLGLVFSADTAADIDAAEERVARRDAMLDGLRQITDLGLTVTRGRWIPFVRTGRDALLDSFRHTDEVDRALSELGEVRDQYRLRMSELIAARLVHNHELDRMPATMSLDDWLRSDDVRDAITDLRTQAGQSFDEVFDVLESER